MKKIIILLFDGVMDSSLAITMDVLRTVKTILSAQQNAPRIQVKTLAIKPYINTACGLRMKIDFNFKTISQKPDWIIVPGLGMNSHQELNERLANKDTLAAIKWIADTELRTTKIGASCSSVFLLAESGLLSGRKATTTWWLAQTFRVRYPDVLLDETKMLVHDGSILTAGAALSQMDLMLAIVSDVLGKSVANLCSRYLLIDQRASQARYMMQSHLLHEDKTVIAAERWIDAHIAQAITVKELSVELAISPKTLARRIENAIGISTIKFIQRRKISYASHLIETSSLSIEEISSLVGYRDSTALRKLIKREFGVTPSLLR